MEAGTKKRTDWLFIIGLIPFVPGYLIFAFPTMVSFFGLPFYVIGGLLIVFSRKRWWIKVLIILPTLILNWLAIRYLMGK